MAASPIVFRPNNATNRKVRVCLTGISGSGKTLTALLSAKALGGKILVIDSERGNSSIYAKAVPHDVYQPETHNPTIYANALKEAAGQYAVVILDSLTHEWKGKGGIMEIVDNIGKFKGWQVATPMHNAFLDAIVSFPGHVIATCRCKMDLSIEKNEKGETVVRKVGLGLDQRDGIESEFDVVLMIGDDGSASPYKKVRSLDPILTTLFGQPLDRADIPATVVKLSKGYAE